MLIVLYGVDRRGQLIVDEHNISSLMQGGTEREFAIVRLILQRDILPDDSKGGA